MRNEFSCKIFREGDDVLLAVSDLSLVGKSFEEGDFHLEVSKDFYYGKECDRDAVLRLVKDATIVNAVGKRIIDLMVKERLVDKDTVLIIKGVPHAQLVKIRQR